VKVHCGLLSVLSSARSFRFPCSKGQSVQCLAQVSCAPEGKHEKISRLCCLCCSFAAMSHGTPVSRRGVENPDSTDSLPWLAYMALLTAKMSQVLCYTSLIHHQLWHPSYHDYSGSYSNSSTSSVIAECLHELAETTAPISSFMTHLLLNFCYLRDSPLLDT